MPQLGKKNTLSHEKRDCTYRNENNPGIVLHRHARRRGGRDNASQKDLLLHANNKRPYLCSHLGTKAGGSLEAIKVDPRPPPNQDPVGTLRPPEDKLRLELRGSGGRRVRLKVLTHLTNA